MLIPRIRSTKRNLLPFRHKKVQPDERMTGQKDNLVALHFKYDFWHRTATAGSDVVQSGRRIFDDVFQHLWPYIDNNTANVVFQMVKRLWLIRIDQ
ncbi:adhesion G protein-coupled receptor B2 [Trichonephila clavipes]|nr:adhesion G protein-coupled receptor B2 [Trichonephila clavipes]